MTQTQRRRRITTLQDCASFLETRHYALRKSFDKSSTNETSFEKSTNDSTKMGQRTEQAVSNHNGNAQTRMRGEAK